MELPEKLHQLVGGVNKLLATQRTLPSKHGFDGDTEVCVRPVAEYATQVIVRSPLYAASLELIDGIVADVAEKAAISTAIGFLMASRDLSKEQALSHLRALALETGSTLAEIADQTTAQDQTTAEDQTASGDGPRHRP